jgi:hypothetical protein
LVSKREIASCPTSELHFEYPNAQIYQLIPWEIPIVLMIPNHGTMDCQDQQNSSLHQSCSEYSKVIVRCGRGTERLITVWQFISCQTQNDNIKLKIIQKEN